MTDIDIAKRTKNLFAANNTLKYVRGKMDIGPSNKIPNSYYGWPARTLCVAESRAKSRASLKEEGDLQKARGGGDFVGTLVNSLSSWATHYGCGNCGEQSAMAFVHLRDVQKVAPLDWMQVGNWVHGFVVIGRDRDTDPTKAVTWNREAIICDPWANIVDEGWLAVRLQGRKCEVIYRFEVNAPPDRSLTPVLPAISRGFA